MRTDLRYGLELLGVSLIVLGAEKLLGAAVDKQWFLDIAVFLGFSNVLQSLNDKKAK